MSNRLRTFLRLTFLGTTLLTLSAFACLYGVSKISENLGTKTTVQHTERNVYNGLTIFSDDGENLDAAKLIINAPIEAEIGELVRFDVSASCAKSFKWVLVPKSGDFEVYDGGKRAVFSARKRGEYLFIVACAYENTVDIVTHTIRVGNPIPKPGDYPVVSKPEADAPFSRWLPYWCSLTVRTEAETRKLADSFDGVAANIAAGVYTTPEEIIKATGEANRQALGDSLESWKMVLLSLQNEFKARADAGTLASPEQHADMWREVAAGLRAYADLFETLK